MTEIRTMWGRHRWYRWLLVAALAFAILHLLMNGFYIVGDVDYSAQIEWIDLGSYLEAAENLELKQPLYGTAEDLPGFGFLYSPTFALLFSWLFGFLPPLVTAVILAVLHVAAYVYLYFLWRGMFRDLGLARAVDALALTAPLWLVYWSFWADLNWLNVHVFVVLAFSLFLRALLARRLAPSVLWFSLLAISKPQWCIVAILPLVLGQWRFFLRLIACAALAYVAIAAGTILVLGPEYGLAQYQDYVQFVGITLTRAWPWRVWPDYAYFGTNHSPAQAVYFLAGVSPASKALVLLIKLVLLAPLAAIGVKAVVRRPLDRERGLAFAFALTLWSVYLWIDVTWADAFLVGIAIWTYLVSVLSRASRFSLGSLFVVYSLSELAYVGGFLLLGDALYLDDPQIELLKIDPNAYFPLLTLLVLLFYGALLVRLWGAAERPVAQDGR